MEEEEDDADDEDKSGDNSNGDNKNGYQHGKNVVRYKSGDLLKPSEIVSSLNKRDDDSEVSDENEVDDDGEEDEDYDDDDEDSMTTYKN